MSFPKPPLVVPPEEGHTIMCRGVRLTRKGDEYIITGVTGDHTLAVAETDAARLTAHWRGFLEQCVRLLAPGDTLGIYVNQGRREARVLAVHPPSQMALVEYEMPMGTTALRVVDALTCEATEVSVSYTAPGAWYSLLTRADALSWRGRGQGRGQGYRVGAERSRTERRARAAAARHLALREHAQELETDDPDVIWVGRPVPPLDRVAL